MPILLWLACLAAPADPWTQAAANAEQSNAALRCAVGVLHGWWALRDEPTALLPQRIDSRIWTPSNAVADLFPFLVLTAARCEPERLPDLLVTLRHELALSTRQHGLPDNFDLTTHRFAETEPDPGRLVFGASEYCKDGLLPVWELLGRGVWLERLRGLEEGVWEVAPIESDFGRLPASDTEVNGEQLQVLSRLWWATRDPRYLEWATRLGRAYCEEVIPGGGGLPSHVWDFTAHRPVRDAFSLNDHGNEIVLGLAEWYIALRAADPAAAATAEPVLRRMFDRLLEVGRNPDRLWYALLQPSTGTVLNERTPDTWGYALCGVYAFGQELGEPRYIEAAGQALASLDQPKYYEWGGADSYADSLEGCLLLLNRVPTPAAEAWLDQVVPRWLALQQPDGVIEGWYGDGNSARTALMLSMYRTQGAFAVPYRDDLRLGAVRDERGLCLRLTADQSWSGRLIFDYPRHRENLGLAVDYPRLNQFPEWWTVERTGLYEIEQPGTDAPPELRLGEELIEGYPVELAAGKTLQLHVAAAPVGEIGGPALEISGPAAVGTAGDVVLELRLRAGRLDATGPIELTSDWGTVEPSHLELGTDEATVTLRGRSQTDRTVTVTATPRRPWLAARHTVRLLHDPLLTGFADLAGDGTWRGESYAWTGARPIAVELDVEPGVDQVLVLRWGAKGDERAARVMVGGRTHEIVHGGYDGFEEVTIALPAELLAEPRLAVRLEALEGRAGAFISEIRVRRAE